MKSTRLVILCLMFAVPVWSQQQTAEGMSRPGKLDIFFQEPALTLRADFVDDNRNRALDAEEQGTLLVEVNNEGPGKAYELNFRLSGRGANHVTISPTSELIELLQPDGSAQLKFTLKAGFELSDGQLKLRLTATEKYNAAPTPLEITIETRAFLPPQLAVTDVAVNDDRGTYVYGNGNRRIEKGETVEVQAIVQNRGQGEATKVAVDVSFDHASLIAIGKRHFNLGDLAPGKYATVKFSVTVTPDYDGPADLPIVVTLSEARGKYGKKERLALQLNQTAKAAKDLAPETIVFQAAERPEFRIEAAPALRVDVEYDLPSAKDKNNDAFAVVIGNRDYQQTQPVEFALNDARVMKDYLVKSLGYKEGNIYYLPNATKSQFEEYFGVAGNHKGRLFNSVKPGRSEVFIYYSGHGAPSVKNRKGYFVPVGCNPQYVEITGYSLDTFYENISRIPAKSMTVVLDACFSGANILQNISPLVPQINNPVMKMPNGVVLASSSGTQVSSWYSEKQHSMFTYFFLKAIHNRNGDANKDKKLTFQEIHDYISDHSEGVPYYARLLHGVEQTPTIQGQKKDRILVRY